MLVGLQWVSTEFSTWAFTRWIKKFQEAMLAEALCAFGLYSGPDVLMTWSWASFPTLLQLGCLHGHSLSDDAAVPLVVRGCPLLGDFSLGIVSNYS